RALLLVAFRANPRGTYRWFWERNLAAVRERGLDVPTAALFGVLLLAVAMRWRQEGPLMKAALAMLPPLAVAYALVGIYGEIRIFYEVVPPAAVWVFNAVLQAAGLAVAGRPSGAG